MKSADYYLQGATLLVDKPYGCTSFEVVKRVRGIIRRKYGLKDIKVGHAGTLDPLATGLLIICTGKATKGIDSLLNDSKTYTGQGKLGYTSPSFDCETEEVPTHLSPPDTLQILKDAACTFEGRISQTPPLYSAIKVDGKRAYELARAGKQKELKSREIDIYRFEIQDFDPPFFTFTAHCSKGTYIRSLIHDFGQEVGCGAYLTGLRRIASGTYSVSDALPFDTLEDAL